MQKPGNTVKYCWSQPKKTNEKQKPHRAGEIEKVYLLLTISCVACIFIFSATVYYRIKILDY